MSEDLKQRVRAYFDDLSAGRLDTAHTLFADDAVMHSPMGDLSGLERISGMGGLFKSALPDGRIQAQEILVDGDLLAYRLTAEGTHEGEFAGMPGTGKRIAWTNQDLARIRDGKVVELWGGPDMFTILTQMGAIPQPAAAAG